MTTANDTWYAANLEIENFQPNGTPDVVPVSETLLLLASGLEWLVGTRRRGY